MISKDSKFLVIVGATTAINCLLFLLLLNNIEGILVDNFMDYVERKDYPNLSNHCYKFPMRNALICQIRDTPFDEARRKKQGKK